MSEVFQIGVAGLHSVGVASQGDYGVLEVQAPDGTHFQLVFEPHLLEATVTGLQQLASDMDQARRMAGKSPESGKSLVQKIEGFLFDKDAHRDDLLMHAVLERGDKVSYAVPLAELDNLILMLQAARAKWGPGSPQSTN